MSLLEWATAVKNRDGKCMQCGTTDDLHAHHIKQKSTYPTLAKEVSNGITLCYRCHKKEHEQNRPLRIRSSSPQRRTLVKKVAEQADEIARLKESISSLIALHANEINSLKYTISTLRRDNTNNPKTVDSQITALIQKEFSPKKRR